MGVLNFFFLLANMHVVLIIYTQHLSPPNVLSGFGRSESARWKPRRRGGGEGAVGEQRKRGWEWGRGRGRRSGCPLSQPRPVAEAGVRAEWTSPTVGLTLSGTDGRGQP